MDKETTNLFPERDPNKQDYLHRALTFYASILAREITAHPKWMEEALELAADDGREAPIEAPIAVPGLDRVNLTIEFTREDRSFRPASAVAEPQDLHPDIPEPSAIEQINPPSAEDLLAEQQRLGEALQRLYDELPPIKVTIGTNITVDEVFADEPQIRGQAGRVLNILARVTDIQQQFPNFKGLTSAEIMDYLSKGLPEGVKIKRKSLKSILSSLNDKNTKELLNSRGIYFIATDVQEGHSKYRYSLQYRDKSEGPSDDNINK